MKTKKEATNMVKTVNKEKYRVTYTTVDGREREFIWESYFGRKDPLKVMEAINAFVETGKWPSAKEKQRAVSHYADIVHNIIFSLSYECHNDEKLKKEIYRISNIRAREMDEELKRFYLKKNEQTLAILYEFENRDHLKKQKQQIRYLTNKDDFPFHLYICIFEKFHLYSILSIEHYEE